MPTEVQVELRKFQGYLVRQEEQYEVEMRSGKRLQLPKSISQEYLEQLNPVPFKLV